jgi:hypothetical protein
MRARPRVTPTSVWQLGFPSSVVRAASERTIVRTYFRAAPRSYGRKVLALGAESREWEAGP